DPLESSREGRRHPGLLYGPGAHRGDRRSIDLERARRRYAGGGHPLGDVRPSGDGRLESGRGRGGGQTQKAHVSRANRRRRSRSAARKVAVVRRGGRTRSPVPTRELRRAQPVLRGAGELNQKIEDRRSRTIYFRSSIFYPLSSVQVMRYYPIYLDLK